MFILGLQNDNTQLTRRMFEDMGGMRQSLSYVRNTIKQIESDTMGKHQPHRNFESIEKYLRSIQGSQNNRYSILL